MLKKEKLVWNYGNDDDSPDTTSSSSRISTIPKWTKETFENIPSVVREYEYFLRISMLKFNNKEDCHMIINNNDSNNSSSSSSEKQQRESNSTTTTTLVWKGFLQTIYERVEWTAEYYLRFKFPNSAADAARYEPVRL